MDYYGVLRVGVIITMKIKVGGGATTFLGLTSLTFAAHSDENDDDELATRRFSPVQSGAGCRFAGRERRLLAHHISTFYFRTFDLNRQAFWVRRFQPDVPLLHLTN
jgi:hypothetical protein